MSKRTPSPAMIVAVIALCLGLGGAAIAADLTKPQVKKIAKKVANKQIKKKAPGLSVAHARTADSATTAQNATNASTVGGNSITKISFLAPANTGSTELFNANGLRITASCDGSVRPQIEASATGTPQGVLKVEGNGFGGTIFVDEFSYNSADTPVDIDGGRDRGVAELSFFREDGLVVTVNYSWDDGVRFPDPVCGVGGHAIAG
jgi:hypothetical protein